MNGRARPQDADSAAMMREIIAHMLITARTISPC